MRPCWLVMLFLIVFSSGAKAAEINVGSCVDTDVQAVIDDASDGDIIYLPVCNTLPYADWDDPVKIIDKNVSVIGQGIANTIIRDATGNAYGEAPFWITGTKPFRISGITFVTSTSKANININTTANGWRVDHCEFDALKTGRGIWASGGSGLIDHCIFRDTVQGVSVSSDNTWAASLAFGSDAFVFIEDNHFLYTDEDLDGAVDAYNGARFVFRYNTVENTSLGNHGLCTQYRSTQAFEIYENDFTATVSTGGKLMHIRGGTGVIYNNSATTVENTFGLMNNYRSCTGNPNCAATRGGKYGYCDGSQTIDGNRAISGGLGTHSGANGSAMLTDGAKSWTADELVGLWVWNTTDKSFGKITANTETSVTAVLVPSPDASGFHRGSENAAMLEWPPGEYQGNQWTVNAWVGYTLQNVTDNSSCTVTANSGSTASCNLADGSDNDWDSGDEFRIYTGIPENDWDAGDAYIITAGYPCFDQTGFGPDTDADGYQDSEPVHGWGNTFNGTTAGHIEIQSCGLLDYHLVLGRDVMNTQRPGYQAYPYPHPLQSAVDNIPSGNNSSSNSSGCFICSAGRPSL